MKRKDILQQIKTIIEDMGGIDIDEIKEDSNFQDDLGFDSLNNLNLIIRLEDNFGIDIHDEDVENINTVGEVIDYLQKQLG